jgi:Ca2+:H+ antiporter
MIAFTFFDFYVIGPVYGYSGIANKGFIFAGSILSTVPLAYFIGMAVSSVTAQTGSIAIGSVINATFGSIIEVILYIISLLQGHDWLFFARAAGTSGSINVLWRDPEERTEV